MGFFEKIERPLQAYIEGLKRDRDLSEEGSDPRARLLAGALSSMLDSPEDYEQNAKLTVQWIGGSLHAALLNRDFSDEAIGRTLVLAARIVREVTIRRSSYSALETEILDYYINPKQSLRGDDLAQADYIRNGLPISIQRDLLDKISHADRSAEVTKKNLLEGLDEIEGRISAHKVELSKVESNYNFVGLTAAFNRLLAEKRREQSFSFCATVVLGLVAIAVPVTVVVLRSLKIDVALFDATWSPAGVAILAAIVGVEVVALYFFRVALKNYQVSRSQITSLQLRNALCAFIEGYMDFRERRGKDPAALSGFEQLVFAGLPDGGDGLPSTIDGLAQVADIVRAARSA